MGLFRKKESSGTSGVSLIVNQLEKKEGRRQVPKVLIVLAIVLIFFTAGYFLTLASDQIDRQTIPRRDETVPRDQDLGEYKVKFTLVWDAVNSGSGYSMSTKVTERSQDLLLVRLTNGDKGPGTDLWISLDARSCSQGGSFTNQKYEFPATFTVYYPNNQQSPTRDLAYCISDDERAQLTYSLQTGQQGFGTYEVRGSILDGEVVACGFLQKCWKYHDHPFVYKFDVKKEGLFW